MPDKSRITQDHILTTPNRDTEIAQEMDGKLFRAIDVGGGRVLFKEVIQDEEKK